MRTKGWRMSKFINDNSCSIMDFVAINVVDCVGPPTECYLSLFHIMKLTDTSVLVGIICIYLLCFYF